MVREARNYFQNNFFIGEEIQFFDEHQPKKREYSFSSLLLFKYINIITIIKIFRKLGIIIALDNIDNKYSIEFVEKSIIRTVNSVPPSCIK